MHQFAINILHTYNLKNCKNILFYWPKPPPLDLWHLAGVHRVIFKLSFKVWSTQRFHGAVLMNILSALGRFSGSTHSSTCGTRHECWCSSFKIPNDKSIIERHHQRFAPVLEYDSRKALTQEICSHCCRRNINRYVAGSARIRCCIFLDSKYMVV